MSRTDKTAPWHVKAFYYPNWVEECHNHTKGYCDLPPKPTPGNVDWWSSRGTCGWMYSQLFLCDGMQRCGCPVCNRDPYYEVPKRKRDRMAGSRYVREGWRAEY